MEALKVFTVSVLNRAYDLDARATGGWFKGTWKYCSTFELL